jgi:hypothetical protein
MLHIIWAGALTCTVWTHKWTVTLILSVHLMWR